MTKKIASNWNVYIILASDNTWYTGITTDVERRWAEHCVGKKGAKYFRGRKPVKLLFLETGHTRSSAAVREHEIKKLSRRKKEHLISANEMLFETPLIFPLESK